jgi:hypothetical protein
VLAATAALADTRPQRQPPLACSAPGSRHPRRRGKPGSFRTGFRPRSRAQSTPASSFQYPATTPSWCRGIAGGSCRHAVSRAAAAARPRAVVKRIGLALKHASTCLATVTIRPRPAANGASANGSMQNRIGAVPLTSMHLGPAKCHKRSGTLLFNRRASALQHRAVWFSAAEDRLLRERDRGFADSPVEGTRFETLGPSRGLAGGSVG